MRSALSALGGFAQSAAQTATSASPISLALGDTPADELLDRERTHNRLLIALREESSLREVLLSADGSLAPNMALYLLLPQSSTLDDVHVTVELVKTHLVHLQRGVPRGTPRSFTSLNGLCGTCQADGEITVNGRLRRAADTDSALGGSVGGWAQDGRGAAVPQLESQVVVLRESQLQASAKLPLRSPVGLMIVSDPLFFPGCGWKLPLALRRCTHRFLDVDLDSLALADLPALLDEYKVFARAWVEGVGLGADEEVLPAAEPHRAALMPPPPPPPPSAATSLTAAATPATPADGADGEAEGSMTRRRFAAISKAAEALLREPAPSKAPSPSAAALLRSLLGPAAADAPAD